MRDDFKTRFTYLDVSKLVHRDHQISTVAIEVGSGRFSTFPEKDENPIGNPEDIKTLGVAHDWTPFWLVTVYHLIVFSG